MVIDMRGGVPIKTYYLSLGLSLSLLGCSQGPTLAIEINGDGSGWVNIDVGAVDITSCTQSCEVELPGPEATVKITAGTTQQLTSSSCPGSPRHCELTVGDGQELTFTFEKDPHELATLFLDEAPRAVGFAASGDLVIATETSLRRVKLDGTEVWRLPRESTDVVRTSASGLIAAGGLSGAGEDLEVYREDGTLVWKYGVQGLSGIAFGTNDDVIIKNIFGRVLALSAVDGSERWSGLGPLSKDGAWGVEADQSGTVTVRTGYQDRLIRFSATGERLSDWAVPTPLAAIEIGMADRIVGTSPSSYTASVPVTYTRFDAAGVATSFLSGPAFVHDFSLHADGIFEWRQDGVEGTAPQLVRTTLTIASLDQSGAVRWQVVKGEVESTGTKTLDQITAVSTACDHDGHRCVISGHYAGWPHDGQTDMEHWLAVYGVP
jgi:hypothetical protein